MSRRNSLYGKVIMSLRCQKAVLLPNILILQQRSVLSLMAGQLVLCIIVYNKHLLWLSMLCAKFIPICTPSQFIIVREYLPVYLLLCKSSCSTEFMDKMWLLLYVCVRRAIFMMSPCPATKQATGEKDCCVSSAETKEKEELKRCSTCSSPPS